MRHGPDTGGLARGARLHLRLGRRARRAVFAALAAVSALAGAAAHEASVARLAAWAPGVFAVRRAEIAGLEQTPAADVVVGIGLRRGVPRGAIDCAALESRLAAHPKIAQAHVSRALPGILLVRLIERRPVARLRGPEALWWVDATGMPFAPEPAGADGNEDADASLDALPLLVTERAVAAGVRSAVLASAIGQIGQLAAAGLAVSEWHLERRVADDHQPAALARLRGSIPPLLLGEGDRGTQIHTLARALAIGQVSDAGLIDLRFRNQVIFWPDRPGIGASGKRAPPEG